MKTKIELNFHNQIFDFRVLAFCCCIAVCILLLAGCSDPPEFRINQVEVLKQESIAGLKPGEHFDQQHINDVAEILTALFGTPQDPHFPALGEDSPITSIDKLKMAAGPVHSGKDGEQGGLYREHCSHCHGISGDGAGPTSSFLNPYPRDFRLGKFKFKSTPIGKTPTNEDLKTVLVNGIPGTAMPSFMTLPDKELDALVDYVKYLSIRGQVERRLIKDIATLEEEFPRLIDISLKSPKTENSEVNEDPAEDDEIFLEQVDLILEKLDEETGRWLDGEDAVTEVPEPPAEFDPHDVGHRDFVALGRTLYHGKANCIQCHGDTSVGDGQTTDYDDWTNDWLKGANVDTNDPESYRRFVEAGAFPPRNLIPRNLRIASYRGGSKPNDIYLRVVNGIEGTPMPATTALTEEELWAVVAYVRQLPYEHKAKR